MKQKKKQGIGNLSLNIEMTLKWSEVVIRAAKAGGPLDIAFIW